MNVSETKRCSVCGEVKAYSEFYKRSGSRTGLRWECKRCGRDYYQAHSEQQAAAASARYSRNPVEMMCVHAKKRATKNGLEFSLKSEQLYRPTHCPVFGVELDYSGLSHRADNAASLDRIDSSAGYVPENSRIISWGANRKKRNLTLAELDAISAYVRGGIPT